MQKTAYEMRISDWSSDVCSSDLHDQRPDGGRDPRPGCKDQHDQLQPRDAAGADRRHCGPIGQEVRPARPARRVPLHSTPCAPAEAVDRTGCSIARADLTPFANDDLRAAIVGRVLPSSPKTCCSTAGAQHVRSEEHTSELQSLMRNSYAVFCLTKKNNITTKTNIMKCNNKRNTRIPTKHRTCHPTEYNKNYQHIQNSRTTHLILKITTE